MINLFILPQYYFLGKTSNSSNLGPDELITIKGNFTNLPVEEALNIYSTKEEKKFDFRNIQRINKYLGFQGADNLWYIFHPVAKSSFGPCSSENLQEMYTAGMLDGESELRFIDVYCLKNTDPFSFFKLKDMEDPRFINRIEPSAILKKAIKVPVGFPNGNLDSKNNQSNSRKISSNKNEENDKNNLNSNNLKNNNTQIEVVQVAKNSGNEINSNTNKANENNKNNKEIPNQYKFNNNNNNYNNNIGK